TPQDAKAHILQDKPHLLQLGLTEQQIDGFDPTPQNLQMLVSKGMDLKTALDQADKTRNFDLKKDQFGETQRHNQAGEATAQGQLGVARGNLGVAQANLGLRGAELRQKQSDSSALSGKPMSAAAQNLQNTHLEALQTTSGINDRLQSVVGQ